MRVLFVVLVLVSAGSGVCRGSVIFDGPLAFPAGMGASTTVLTIDANDTGSGCVGFVGGADVTGPGACPGGFNGPAGDESAALSMTRTISQLAGTGVSTAQGLLIVLAPPQPAAGLTVEDLAIVFFDPAQDMSFTATLAGTPMLLPPSAAGAGMTAGYAFRLDAFQASLASDFFANGANRVGAALTLSGAGQGAATLFLSADRGVAAVPEPGTLGITAAGLLTAMAAGRVRRRARR